MKRLLISSLLVISFLPLFSQGLSVAPTRIYFSNDLGESQTKKVTIYNKTSEPQSYQVSFIDFEVDNRQGKPVLMKANESTHSISKWISANPSFVTVKPGESMEVQVTLDIPNVPEAKDVKWGAMSIKLAREQVEPLASQKQLGMAIVNTFQIVVYLFQNPPSITNRQAEIYEFKRNLLADDQELMLGIENTGEAILDCNSYLEYTNLGSGATTKSDKKHFTLLPDGAKDLMYKIPEDLPKGKYSVMGVVDYGSSTEVQAAELEITIN